MNMINPVDPRSLLDPVLNAPELVSLCAMLLMDAAKEVDNMFGVRQSVSHTTRQAVTDISKIVRLRK